MVQTLSFKLNEFLRASRVDYLIFNVTDRCWYNDRIEVFQFFSTALANSYTSRTTQSENEIKFYLTQVINNTHTSHSWRYVWAAIYFSIIKFLF